MAHLQFTGLRKSYGDTRILHGIDLSIDDGEFVVFDGEGTAARPGRWLEAVR